MSAVQQLDYVCDYYKSLTGKMKTLGDTYMAVLAGKYSPSIGKPDSYVLWSNGSKQYQYNKGLDINKDGNITKAEATQMLIDRRNTYEKK